MDFTLKTKISTAIKARPALKEILPAFHPAFKKLQNPLLSRTLARLVTVADAAKIAGVSPEAMLEVMNTKGRPEVLPGKPTELEATPMPPWYNPELIDVLDVRDELNAGSDPLKTIIAATRALPPGRILELVTTFEPAPMIRLLRKQGWVSWVRWEADDCHVAFWYTGATKVAVKDEVVAAHLDRSPSGWTVDVRGLEPPEPMIHVLRALEDKDLVLPLTIKHQRVPAMLFPRLEQRGFTWTVNEHDDGVDIIIARVTS